MNSNAYVACQYIAIAKKSVVAKTYIPKGTAISKSMVDIKRPGSGLPPKYIYEIIGKVAKMDINTEDLFTKEMY